MKTLEKYKNHESNLVRHAYRELELIGGLEAESQQQMATHILDIVERFSEEGHSGFSAGYALSILKRVMAFEPVTPLTGEPDEWTEVMDGCFQNKRFSEVFKDGADAQAYWIQAIPSPALAAKRFGRSGKMVSGVRRFRGGRSDDAC